MKRYLRHLFFSRYISARLYYHCINSRRLRGADRIYVVYQMGKVGSSSVAETLKKVVKPGMPVFHVHTLSTHRIRFNELEYFGVNGVRAWLRPYPPRAEHLLASEFLRREIPKSGSQPRKRWKVISLVRDPVARNVSAFFQMGDLLIPNFSEKIATGRLLPGLLRRIFLESFSTHDVPLYWLEREVGKCLGIDVYSDSFAHSKGYHVYRGPFADLLLFKLEQLDRCGSRALSEFLETDVVELQHANIATKKVYSTPYRKFKNQLVLPPEYLDWMYGSRFARHFYTDGELRGFREKWSGSREEARRACG